MSEYSETTTTNFPGFESSYMMCSELRAGRGWRQMSSALLLSLLVAASASAQSTGALVGTLRSPNGELVVGAVVTATGDGRVRGARTDEAGEFRFEDLVPGPQTLTTDQAPFVLDRGTPVEIVAGITIRRDLALVPPDRARSGWQPDRMKDTYPGLSAAVFDSDAVAGGRMPLARIVERSPGVGVARSGGVGHPTSLRFRGAEAGPRALLTDGLPLDDLAHRWHLGVPGTTDMVEVVSGAPTSARRTDLAGLVHLVRRSVDETSPILAIDAEGGDFGWRQLGATVAGRRGEYDWSLGVRNLETDNEVPNSQYSQTALAGTLGVRKGDISAQLMFRGEASDVGLPGQTVFAPADLDAGEDRTQWITGAVLRLHRGPTNKHELRLVASQTNRRSLNPLDSGGVGLQSADNVALRVEMPDFADAAGLRNDTQVAHLTYEFTFVPDEFHYIVFGGTAEAQSGRFGQSTAFDQQRANYALFGEDRLQVLPDLQVTVGGRVVKNGPFGFSAQPRGSLIYDLGRGFTAHGSGGFGVGTPSLEQRFGATFERRGTEDLLQAKSRVYDGGVSGSLLRGRVAVDLTAFRHEYTDLILLGELELPDLSSNEEFRQLTLAGRAQLALDVLAGLRSPLTAIANDIRTGYINVPLSRAYGVEATVSATPISQAELTAVYAYTNSEVLSSTGLIRSGQALPEVPSHRATVTGDLRLGRFSVGATMRYEGARTAGVDFVSRVLGLSGLESYTRWDARGLFQVTDGVAVSVTGENLTDEVYQELLGYPALGRLVRGGIHVSF
ncbi:MAG: TonB-dependent receptor [Acidobacteria bacterium]|nr:TonB-dependent receptor [Acidobacteriota bacterium]